MAVSSQRVNRPFKFGASDRREFIVQDSEVALRLQNDGDGNPVFVGRAKVGTAVSESKWQIQQITYAGGFVTSITWPENALGSASSEYEFVWNDRAGYTYS